jgi:hypothetical protein
MGRLIRIGIEFRPGHAAAFAYQSRTISSALDVLFEQIGILDRLISTVASHGENRRNKGAQKSRGKAKAVERIHGRVELQKLAKGGWDE